LNAYASFRDNGRVGRQANQMRDNRETTWSHSPGGAWPRRAVIGLWVVIFLAGGSALAVKWDGLMARLARPPLADAGGAIGAPPR